MLHFIMYFNFIVRRIYKVKKISFTIVFIGFILVFVGCSKSISAIDFVNIDFTGLNSKGLATTTLDKDAIISHLWGGEAEIQKMTVAKQLEIAQEMDAISDSYTITLDKNENLSNGDTVNVTLSVDSNKTKKFTGGTKKVTVSGLTEPTILTTEDVEKHIVLKFEGVSGKGFGKPENTFPSPLNTINFSVQNNGTLKNGGTISLELTETAEEKLNAEGYVLDKDFNPSYTVKDLKVVANKASDISNIEDLKRVLDENIQREYTKNPYNFLVRYEVTQNKLMYREFSRNTLEDIEKYGESDSIYDGGKVSGNGNLIGIYTVRKFANEEDQNAGKYSEFIVVNGLGNIYLTDSKANIANVVAFSERFDSTYSLETVVQLYEGYGYTEVE